MRSNLRFIGILLWITLLLDGSFSFASQPDRPVKQFFTPGPLPFPAPLVSISGQLPFTEDWSSGGFIQNGWTFDPSQANWYFAGDYGNPAPSAIFYYEPELTNYSYALVTPILNATDITENVTLKFDIELLNYANATNEGMAVEVSDGSGWQLVKNYTNVNGSFPFTRESFNITSIAAGHNFSLRFRAYGENSLNINWWTIDNIKICELAVGNLTGVITKLSDGEPVEGVLITIHNDTIGTFSATSGINGLYSILGAEAGEYVLTIMKEGFNRIDGNVTIEGDQTVTQNFQVTAPVISVSPDSLIVTVAVGEMATREVTVSNTGNGPLYWNRIVQSTRRAVIQGSDGNFPRGTSAISAGRAPTTHSMPCGTLTGRGDIGYAFDLAPGNFFSFDPQYPATQHVISPTTMLPTGGSFDALNTGFMYVIDYNDNHLKKVDIASGAVSDIGLCDPGSFTNLWTGISVDKTTNIMYGMTTNLSGSKLYTIDMNTG
ncbi:MAG: carboxypeptidase-like regulatory domain-containing protein, partial [Bacteroidota bacterium]